jgi:hypothetical protein
VLFGQRTGHTITEELFLKLKQNISLQAGIVLWIKIQNEKNI